MAPPRPRRLLLLTAPGENAHAHMLTWVSDISEDGACWCESLTRPLTLSVDRRPLMSVNAARNTGKRAAPPLTGLSRAPLRLASQPWSMLCGRRRKAESLREHICRKQRCKSSLHPTPTAHFLQPEHIAHGCIFAFLKLRLSKTRTFIYLH